MVSEQLGKWSVLLQRTFATATIAGCVVLVLKAPMRWMQGVAVATGVSAIGSIAVSKGRGWQSPHQVDDSSMSITSSMTEPRKYTSSWTRPGWPQRGESDEMQVFQGRATAYISDEQVVIRQEEDAGGLYMLDLKRHGNGLSGLWWFYGGRPPHGVFRGDISDDYSAINATWMAPDGTHGGSWTLTLADTVVRDRELTAREDGRS